MPGSTSTVPYIYVARSESESWPPGAPTCEMACAPLENWLTTSKVKGTGEINGCCCCMDLRGGVLTISGVFVRHWLAGCCLLRQPAHF